MSDNDNFQIPTMAPDREDVQRRRSERSDSGRRERDKVVTQRPGGGLLAWSSIVLAIAATGAAVLLWQQGEQAKTQLADVSARVAELESKINSTGDELSQSGAVIQVRLKEHDSEIAKLWDSRKEAKRIAEEQGVNIRNLTTRTGKQGEQLTSNSDQATALAASLDEVLEQIEDFDPAAVNKELAGLSEEVDSLLARIDKNEKTASDNKEWLESVDAFRRQVNERLNAIQNPAPAAPQLQ